MLYYRVIVLFGSRCDVAGYWSSVQRVDRLWKMPGVEIIRNACVWELCVLLS